MAVSASLFAAVALAAVATVSADEKHYLTSKDGRPMLKQPLTLRDEQGGVAGYSGTIWTIAPSGQWREERFLKRGDNERRTPLRSGVLSADQLVQLARALNAHNLAGLPGRAGKDAKVNPHNVVLMFGSQSAMLTGVPPRKGKDLAESIRAGVPDRESLESQVWDRFAHLVQAVVASCKDGETSEQPK